MTWYTGLTADRIDAMAEVLHENGVSNADIEQKIQGLVNVAREAKSDDDIATDADIISYDTTGSITVVIDNSYSIRIYAAGDRVEYVQGKFLATILPGFNPKIPHVIETTYIDQHAASFLWYLDDGSRVDRFLMKLRIRAIYIVN